MNHTIPEFHHPVRPLLLKCLACVRPELLLDLFESLIGRRA